MKAQLLNKYVLEVAVNEARFHRKRETQLRKEEVHGTTMVRLVDADGRRACQELERSIRRHCDGVGDIRIQPMNAAEVCEYCRAPWVERSPYYNGGCCPQDEEHNPFPLLGPSRADSEGK